MTLDAVPDRVNVLGALISDTSLEELSELVVRRGARGERLTVGALALHGVTVAHRDPAYRARLSELDVLTPDGAPVAWAARALHRRPRLERVPGPDLSARVLERAAESGVSVYFFGSTAETLDALRARLEVRLPDLVVAGTRPSRFRAATPEEEEALREDIEASGAGILFVGLGCPRQEVWVQENAPFLRMPILAVGAAFDFLAGTVPRAPSWLRRSGFEWVHRILSEPRRLLPRYLVTGPRFVRGCLAQAVSGPPGHRPVDPTHLIPERYG